MSRDMNAGSNLVCFLLGAAVGAAVALLYAPQEGEATRRMIGEKATEVKGKATEVGSTVAQNAKKQANVVSDKWNEFKNRGQQAASDTMDAATDKTRAVVDSVTS